MAASVPTLPCGFTQVTLAQFLKEADKGELKFERYFFTRASDVIPGTATPSNIPRCLKCGCTIDEHNGGSPPIQVPLSARSPVVDPAEAELVVAMKEFFMPLLRGMLIPKPVSKNTSVPPLVKQRMLDYYKSANCLILRKVLLKGVDSKEKYKGRMMPCYPAVHAHIVPQSTMSALEMLQIDVDDARNALPLFKHIELEWDRGNIAIIPVAGESGTEFHMRMVSFSRFSQVSIRRYSNSMTRQKTWNSAG